jgi:hypothetical protein
MKNALYLTLMVLISFLGGYFMRGSETVDVVASADEVTATIKLEQEELVEDCVLKEALIEREEVSTKDALLSCKTHGNIKESKETKLFPNSNVIKEIQVSPSTNLLAEVIIVGRVQSDNKEVIITTLPRSDIAGIIKVKSSELKDLIKLVPKKASVMLNKTNIKYKLIANYAYSASYPITSKTYISQLLPVESNSCFDDEKRSSSDLVIEAKARSPGII